MSDIEDEIRLAIAGKIVEVTGKFCDFTIAQQNEAIQARGATPKSNSIFIPQCQKTVVYIVAAVIINENNQVLMMQEAKFDCMEKWYLPAGRVEPDENLIDAVKREVLEETGLDMEPTSLITVETVEGSWFRFVFTGEIIGGTLKTIDKADKDSLQACWVEDIETLSLRRNDIIPLIQKCRNYVKGVNGPYHSELLPVTNLLSRLYLKVVACIRKNLTNKMHVLHNEDPSPHLPICEIYPNRNLHSTLHEFMVEIFGKNVPQHRPHGLLGIEFGGRTNHDGMCLTILVSFKPFLEDVANYNMNYSWLEISSGVADSIIPKLPRNMTVNLNVIR